jgi:hypothetical protein
MRALFPPWSNTLLKLGAIVAFAFLLMAATAPMIFVRMPYATGQLNERQQPIQFDHRHHTRDDGIDCFYCHFEAKRSSYAGVPPTALCMGCHGQVWNDSPFLALLRDSYFTKTPIAWRRVTAVPDFVHFDHSAHIQKGVGCVTCHGRIDQMAEVYQAKPLTMDFCIDCHRSPESRLRPLDRITDMTWQPEEPGQGARLRSELGANPSTNCSTCHY